MSVTAIAPESYGVYHWDTFDNEVFLICECASLEEAEAFLRERYGDRIRDSGADQVDIVHDRKIVKKFKVG